MSTKVDSASPSSFRVDTVLTKLSPVHSHLKGEAPKPTDSNYSIVRTNEVFAKLEEFIPDSTRRYTQDDYCPPVVLVGENEPGGVIRTYQQWIAYAENELRTAQEIIENSSDKDEVATLRKEVGLLEQQLIALRYRTGIFTPTQQQVNTDARACYSHIMGSPRIRLGDRRTDPRYEAFAELIKRYKPTVYVGCVAPKELQVSDGDKDKVARLPQDALVDGDIERLKDICRSGAATAEDVKKLKFACKTGELARADIDALKAARRDVAVVTDDDIWQMEVACQKRGLSPEDEQQLMRACMEFPLFVDLLLSRNTRAGVAKDSLVKEFMKWSLLSGCSVGVFVQALNERIELTRLFMDRRVGAVERENGFRFEKLEATREDSPRVVTLRIDGKRESIHGEAGKNRTITLTNTADSSRPPLELTVRQAFKAIIDKRFDYGDVEYFHGNVQVGEEGDVRDVPVGLGNMNVIHSGSVDGKTGEIVPFDFTQIEGSPTDQAINFLNKLPAFSVKTKSEMQNLFPGQKLPERDGEHGFAVCSTRSQATLNISGTHGFMMLIMRQADGRYRLYPMGLQPDELPNGTLSILWSLYDTRKASIHYIDDSVYTHREFAGEMHVLPEEDFNKLVMDVRQLFIEGRQGNLIFQPLGENCASLPARLLRKRITNKLEDPLFEVISKLSKDKRTSLDPNEITRLCNRTFGYFDDEALSKLLDTMMNVLLNPALDVPRAEGDIEELKKVIHGAIDLIKATMMKDHDSSWDPAALKVRLGQILNTYARATVEERSRMCEELKTQLKELVRLAVRGQHYYRKYVLDADFDAPLGGLVSVLNWIPWAWLRNALYTFITFVFLWSFRWHTITEKKVDGDKTVEVTTRQSVLTSEYWDSKEIHFPAQLFDHQENVAPQLRKDALACISNIARAALGAPAVEGAAAASGSGGMSLGGLPGGERRGIDISNVIVVKPLGWLSTPPEAPPAYYDVFPEERPHQAPLERKEG